MLYDEVMTRLKIIISLYYGLILVLTIADVMDVQLKG